MTGPGSRLAAAPLRVTSFSMSQTASRYSPTKAVTNQLIKAARPMVTHFGAREVPRWVSPYDAAYAGTLTRPYPSYTDACRPWFTGPPDAGQGVPAGPSGPAPGATPVTGALAPADILAPDLRIAFLEFPHNGRAALIVDQQNVHSVTDQEIQVAGEGGGLAHHHPGYLEKEDRPRAHLARGKRGVQRHVPVGRLPSGIAQAGDLAVRDGVAQLHPLVVLISDQPAAGGQRGTHRDSPGVEAGPCLAERHVHHRVVVGSVGAHRLTPPLGPFRGEPNFTPPRTWPAVPG